MTCTLKILKTPTAAPLISLFSQKLREGKRPLVFENDKAKNKLIIAFYDNEMESLKTNIMALLAPKPARHSPLGSLGVTVFLINVSHTPECTR
jgi:hypothetical protein